MAPQAPFPTSKLAGKRVLVVGGSSGIGFGVALASLAAGARVHVASANPQRVDDAVRRLKEAYPQGHATGSAADLGNPATADANALKLLQDAVAALGGACDHIAHTAGDKLRIGPLSSFDAATVQAAGQVRFFAPVAIARHLSASPGKFLAVSPDSTFTVTSGLGGDKPRQGWAVMAGFLAGMEGLARGLAVELAPIRANLVMPGGVLTEMWGPLDAKAVEGFAKGTLTKRMGRVEDVAEAYLYIMKDGFATGTTVRTGGGSSLL
ncbi:hypothetical protein DFJ74DRAFT_699207 [Hyaloraphidium curvatum]|nr:hypothetical protein DFJ74DRAFT_699207 [Hyaloraphidium curvatum]